MLENQRFWAQDSQLSTVPCLDYFGGHVVARLCPLYHSEFIALNLGESSEPIRSYWHASQSGSRMEQTLGSTVVSYLTAFKAPSVMVDFSAFDAPMLRK